MLTKQIVGAATSKNWDKTEAEISCSLLRQDCSGISTLQLFPFWCYVEVKLEDTDWEERLCSNASGAGT